MGLAGLPSRAAPGCGSGFGQPCCTPVHSGPKSPWPASCLVHRCCLLFYPEKGSSSTTPAGTTSSLHPCPPFPQNQSNSPCGLYSCLAPWPWTNPYSWLLCSNIHVLIVCAPDRPTSTAALPLAAEPLIRIASKGMRLLDLAASSLVLQPCRAHLAQGSKDA